MCEHCPTFGECIVCGYVHGVYVVRDASGEYVRNEDGTERTPASNEAFEFAAEDDARAARTRATDKVLLREIA